MSRRFPAFAVSANGAVTLRVERPVSVGGAGLSVTGVARLYGASDGTVKAQFIGTAVFQGSSAPVTMPIDRTTGTIRCTVAGRPFTVKVL